MKIVLGIAGFFVALIAVAGIILLIIAVVKGKIKTPGAPSGKILKTIAVIAILSVLGWFGYRYFTDLPSRQQAPAVAQQEQLPICAGGEYDFSTAEIPGEIAVGFQAGCISQVTLPSRVVFRTDTSADVKIKFIDGSEYIDGPKKQVWYGLKRGVFKVRGLSEAGTMKITLEKSS